MTLPRLSPADLRQIIDRQADGVTKMPELFEPQQATVIEFTCFGDPKPQGSKLSHALYHKDGSPVTKNGRVVTVTRNDNPHVISWRGAVAQAARAVYGGPLIKGPVSVSVVFFIPRPKGHFGSGKNAGKLKTSAPKYHITKPDGDKLARAIWDALSKVIYDDDSQIVDRQVSKRYGDCAETRVRIETILE